MVKSPMSHGLKLLAGVKNDPVPAIGPIKHYIFQSRKQPRFMSDLILELFGRFNGPLRRFCETPIANLRACWLFILLNCTHCEPTAIVKRLMYMSVKISEGTRFGRWGPVAPVDTAESQKIHGFLDSGIVRQLLAFPSGEG
jgi:hypothetical protein